LTLAELPVPTQVRPKLFPAINAALARRSPWGYTYLREST